MTKEELEELLTSLVCFELEKDLNEREKQALRTVEGTVRRKLEQL